MSDLIIKVENLGKQYQLGQIGTGTLTRDLQRWYARIRGKEDPTLKIGQRSTIESKSDSDFTWALRDINLEIHKGEVLGIIGRNGAGKSTLLKILSQVTSPTTGQVKVKGRIASLLEVGTGFHPELTGRENIFLNGAILGMTKKEIMRKFDEIVDFSGVEKYIDTPVKRYSSGMYVRLAFAVAAHLEPEILIVDEVLAVGDAEFQSKCIGKMGDISKNSGRTILFVSHNMNAVSKLCDYGILLQKGGIKDGGKISSIINNYLNTAKSELIDYQSIDLINNPGRDNKYEPIAIKMSISSEGIIKTGKIHSGDELIIDIYYKDRQSKINLFQIGVENQLGERIMTIGSYQDPDFKLNKGGNCARCTIKDFNLAQGKYSLTIMLGTMIPFSNVDVVYGACNIDVIDVNYFNGVKTVIEGQGKILKKSKWNLVDL